MARHDIDESKGEEEVVNSKAEDGSCDIDSVRWGYMSCVYVCMCECVAMCVEAYACECECVCVCMCVSECVYVCVCVCHHVCIYVSHYSYCIHIIPPSPPYVRLIQCPAIPHHQPRPQHAQLHCSCPPSPPALPRCWFVVVVANTAAAVHWVAAHATLSVLAVMVVASAPMRVVVVVVGVASGG